MTTLIVQSWSGANDTVIRHWPYYEAAGADRIIGGGTDNGKTKFPDGVDVLKIGDDRYLHGSNVNRRLMFTLDHCTGLAGDHFVISEYDTVFFKPIPRWTGVGGYCAGGATWGSKSAAFYHNPWLIDREHIYRLRDEMALILSEGHCGYGTPESSPDVFFAWACERLKITVQQVLRQYSRNDLHRQDYLDEAREAVRTGVHCVHGVKTAEQLAYITT